MSSVTTRILFFFTLFALASVGAVYISGRSTQIIGTAATAIIDEHLPMVQTLDNLEIALNREENSVERYLISGNKVWLDEFEKERVNYNRRYNDAMKYATETENDRLVEIDELYVQYDNLVRQVVLTRKQDTVLAQKMFLGGDEFRIRIQNLLNQIKSVREGMTIVRQEQIDETLNRHRTVTFYFLLVIVIFFLALAFYLWRYLVRPLTLLLDGIRNFTRGKTDVRIPSIGKDELGELQDAFNEMSKELDLERKRLRSESQSDALTGLFNMRYFRHQLVDEFSRAQRYGRPLTLLMIDVDHFKLYNDRNGHPAGDIVLKEISRILVRNVRGTDLVGRYGGEEFVIFLPETPQESGVNVAEKIRKTVEEHHFPFVAQGSSERPTISIGVASYPQVQVGNDQDLIESADKALYDAKKSGRNRVCVAGNSNVGHEPQKKISDPTKK